MITLRRSLLPTIVALGALAPGAPALAAPEVVATGLDNPRGLTVGRSGAVYVAEAGRGGSGPCLASPEGGNVCLGATGSVSRVGVGRAQVRLATGMPSLARPDGTNALGPHDVALTAAGAVVPVGLAQDPARRAALGELGAGLAQLHEVGIPEGGSRPVVDLGAYEALNNPDQGQPGAEVDSNPTSALARSGGVVVVDAGANALLRVDGGVVSTVAVFGPRQVPAPPALGRPAGTQISMQSVPTAVVSRGGSFYVAELTGFPFPVGGARVYRLRAGGAPEVYARAFTNVIDLAVGPDGSLYVLEIATNGLLSGDPTGSLTRIAPNGLRTLVAREGLVSPGGVAVSAQGDVYVSNRSTSAGEGEVLRVVAGTPVPAPSEPDAPAPPAPTPAPPGS